ncbi:MAG: GDP-mannose 4,6-dehydratase [Nanoarchaeota archaeon]
MTKIVITGGSGFIGSNLTDKLVQNPENYVTVFDNTPFENAPNLKNFSRYKNFRFIQGDVTDSLSLGKVLTKDVDYVYHLASIVGIRNYIADPSLLFRVNVLGTNSVLESALENGIKVLFTSTSEIYGRNPKVPWKEDDDRVLGSTNVDRWNYSTSKAIGEHMINSMHRTKGLNATIVRYFNIYGPKQNPIFVVSETIQKVMNGKNPLIYDGGEQTRCFTFITDAIEGTIKAATDPKAVGETFNIGRDKETRIRDLVSTIIDVCEKTGQIEPENLDTTKHYGKTYEDIIRRVPDVTKAKNVLGWEATTDLRTGLEKTVKWVNENRWWLNFKR